MILLAALPAFGGPIGDLAQTSGVGSDDAFVKLLNEGSQREDHQAPRELRELLVSFKVFRMSFNQGYRYEGGKNLLWWSLYDMSLAQEAMAVRGSLDSFATSRGFQKDGAMYQRPDGHRIRYRGPYPHTGG